MAVPRSISQSADTTGMTKHKPHRSASLPLSLPPPPAASRCRMRPARHKTRETSAQTLGAVNEKVTGRVVPGSAGSSAAPAGANGQPRDQTTCRENVVLPCQSRRRFALGRSRHRAAPPGCLIPADPLILLLLLLLLPEGGSADCAASPPSLPPSLYILSSAAARVIAQYLLTHTSAAAAAGCGRSVRAATPSTSHYAKHISLPLSHY